jgi:hypothetical protein
MGAARANVVEVLAQLGLSNDVEIVEYEVVSEDEARRLRFLGSPTIRVDGHDVELGACDRSEWGLGCRLYYVDGLPKGEPPVAWIKNAILRADR